MLIPSVLNSGILSQRRYAAILYSAKQQKWNSHVNTIERNSFLLLDLAFQHFLFFIPQSSSFCLPKTIFVSAERQQ